MPRRREKGEGSIYWSEKRQQYVGSYELPPKNGKRRRRRVSGETRKAVSDKIAEQRHEGAPGSGIRLNRFLDDWLASSAVTNLRQSTRQSYRDTLRLHVRPLLGETSVTRLSPVALDDWLEDLHRAKRTKATIRYAKVVLRIALQRAVRRGLIPTNPLNILRVRGGTRRVARALSVEELRTLLTAADPWMRVAILLAAACGLRRGEVCGLQWDDVDWRLAELRIERSISAVSGESEPKTEHSRRLVPLSGLVVLALEGHRRRLEVARFERSRTRTVSPWIFASETGRPKHPRNFFRLYEGARARAGLEHVRFHDLRHTCATALISLGGDPGSVSKLLGHADVRTTLDMYHHPARQQQRKSVDLGQRWLVAGGVSSED